MLPIVLAFLALFLGGAGAGLALAEGFARGSLAAEVVSFFALPIAFAAGLQAWYGLALLSLVPRLLGRRPRRREAEPAMRGIPGSFVFLPVSSGAGAVAGIIVGLLSLTHSVWLVAPVYWLAGTVHGALAWRLARAGVLLPPESV